MAETHPVERGEAAASAAARGAAPRPFAALAASRRLFAGLSAACLALALYWACVASGWPDWLRGAPDPFPVGWSWPMLGDARRHALAVPVLAALVTALLLAAGLRWADSASALRRRAALALLPLACFALMIVFLAAKSENPILLLLSRALSNQFLGHILPAFTASFHDLSAGFVAFQPHTCFHCQTHPPGTILFCWVFVRLFDAMPAASAAIVPVLRDTLNLTSGNMTPEQFLALFTSTLGILLFGSLVPLVTWWIARRDADARTAYFAGALSALSPGLVLMTPEFDQLEALPALGAYALALHSAERGSRRHAVAAGVLLAVGSYFTFFVLVFGLPLTLAWLFRGAGREAPRARLLRGLRLCLLGFAGFVAFFGALFVLTGTDIVAIFLQSSPSHFGLTNTQRPYWLYLRHDPLDFANFAGMPVVLAALASAWLRRPGRLHALVGIATVATLALSGLSRGEAGRIWLGFAPFFCLGALPLLAWARERGLPHAAPLLVGLQAVGCTVIGLSWSVP